MNNQPLISFILSLKICKGYEWLIDSVNFYIENINHFCNKYDLSFEILICENVDKKNCCKIIDYLIDKTNVNVFELEQNYPNPFGFNMIESYGKNLCLSKAKGLYSCMTSADQILSEDLFIWMKNNLKPRVFFRFATFEIKRFEYKDSSIEETIELCKKNIIRLCNPGMFPNNSNKKISPTDLGQKSGDIMMLDTESFRKIKGWPENNCFAHVDTSVCFVATNNFPFYIPSKEICTYTFEQPDRNYSSDSKIESYQWSKCLEYSNKITSN
jgi:hypothetical protein